MSNNSENERGYEYYENHPSLRIYNNAPEPGRALLSTGSGGVGPTPLTLNPAAFSRTIPVASVSIDTSRLCNPRVLLTFTCLIGLPRRFDGPGITSALVVSDALTASTRPDERPVDLNFIIVKSNDYGTPQEIGGTTNFSTAGDGPRTQSLCLQHSDCNACNSTSCTTYKIKLYSNSPIPPGLTITNVVFSALAVESLQ